jgi:hypothetical protein
MDSPRLAVFWGINIMGYIQKLGLPQHLVEHESRLEMRTSGFLRK